MKYNWPPPTLYDTICTPAMWKKYPGAPYWNYDGQFIWIVVPKRKIKVVG